MKLLLGLLLALLAAPVVSLVGCAVLEAFLMKNRPQLSWLLPVVVMLASALFQDGGPVLTALLGSLPAACGRCAFFGTATGAVIGAVLNWCAAPQRLSPV